MSSAEFTEQCGRTSSKLPRSLFERERGLAGTRWEAVEDHKSDWLHQRAPSCHSFHLRLSVFRHVSSARSRYPRVLSRHPHLVQYSCACPCLFLLCRPSLLPLLRNWSRVHFPSHVFWKPVPSAVLFQRPFLTLCFTTSPMWYACKGLTDSNEGERLVTFAGSDCGIAWCSAPEIQAIYCLKHERVHRYVWFGD